MVILSSETPILFVAIQIYSPSGFSSRKNVLIKDQGQFQMGVVIIEKAKSDPQIIKNMFYVRTLELY